MRLLCIGVSSGIQIPILIRRLFVLSVAAGYVALLGFPLPATRALIMIAIPYLGLLLKERFSLIEILGYTAVVITLIWPEAWLGLGAWLSFWSVLIIVLLLRWQTFRGLNWLGKVLLFETFLIIGSLPWALLAGLKMNAFSILLNFVLTPVIAFVGLPMALVIAVFPTVAFFAVWEGMFSTMIQLLQITSNSSFHFKNIDWWFVIVALIFVCSVIWLRNRSAICTVILLFLTSQLSLMAKTDQRSFLMTAYDVGHGQAILIEKDGLTLLYDTGGYFSPGESLLETTLFRVLPELDEVIVSHSDSDHSAGLQFIQRTMPEVRIWAGQPERVNSLNQVVNCHNRARISEEIFFIPVPEAFQQNDNDHSCVLFIKHQERSVVITGDSSKLVEYYLLQVYPHLFPADIVVLGHHGSDSSSASDWLKQHRDAFLIASSGDRASPNWPGKRVSRWFETHKTPLNTTAEQGSILISIKEGDISLKNFSSSFRESLIY
jgi:competence protein ComEC